MPSVFQLTARFLCALPPLAVAFALLVCNSASGQGMGGMGGGAGGAPPMRPKEFKPVARAQFGPTGESRIVKEINIDGNQDVREARIRSYLQTRVDRIFDPEVLQADVRRLTSSGLFHDVRTFTTDVEGGIAITYQVFERPTIKYVRFVGNQSFSDEFLAKKCELKVGDALNIYSIDAAAAKVQDFYVNKGFRRCRVAVLEGNMPEHRGVVFSVHEAPKERIWDVEFIGNEVVSDSRLETQIKSKPAMLKYGLFRGAVDPKEVDEDVNRLTTYYRQLGYFHARVGREVAMGDSGQWANITFVIDEGPRYRVRQVTFLGNEKYSDEELRAELQLKDGELYHLSKMNNDLRVLRDKYGADGYIFANVQADPRFFEEPGELDLVYNVSEGEQYRVGEIRVHISGDNPHTRRSVVMNRLSFAPGDILDSRQVRDSERRLKYSQLFRNEPQRGITPRIEIRPPQENASRIADTPLGPRRSAVGTEYRGQSPEEDRAWSVNRVDFDVYVDADDNVKIVPDNQHALRRLPPAEGSELSTEY
jgi:outer membrane protein insertion porin family